MYVYKSHKKGPYVNNYMKNYEHTVCDLLDTKILALSFWGYCSRIELEGRRWDDLSVEQDAAPIMKADVSGGPQFVMAHLNYPAHVRMYSCRHGDASQFSACQARYLERSNSAARQLDAIVRHLEENDPGAILLVYGDHGTMAFMGVKFEDNPTFTVQSHYGVLGGAKSHDCVRRCSRLAPLLVGRGERFGKASQQDHFIWPGQGPRPFHLRGASV